jgi:hypothetical protein
MSPIYTECNLLFGNNGPPSICGSPASLKTPSSPQPPKDKNSISRKTSKSSVSSLDIPSVSSVDIPDIFVVQEDNDIDVDEGKKNTKHRAASSSSYRGSVSPTELGLHFPVSCSPSPPETKIIPPLDFPESASISEGTQLLSPLVTSPSSPQKCSNSNKGDDGDKDEEDEPLVSPDFYSSTSKRKLFQSTSPKNFLQKKDEEDFLLKLGKNQQDLSPASSFLFPIVDDDEKDSYQQDSYSPEFPTSLCPLQFTTTAIGCSGGGDGNGSGGSSSNGDLPSEEEIKINAVIRENIAILQRLKLKSAYLDDDDDYDEQGGEDDSYEEIGEVEEGEDEVEEKIVGVVEELEDDCRSHKSGSLASLEDSGKLFP